MTEENSTYDSGATPYDDVFRTLVVECSELVIPVLNEAFGEKYTGNEEIIFHPNEHFLHRQDGQEEKRISDSSFQVVGETTKSYVIECQSTADSSMLIRIFEYVMLSALDDCRILEDKMDAYIPNAAILFLRSTKTTPDAMTITLHLGEESASMRIPCLKVKNYTIDEIFEKKLYFLIPFYIFTYESRLRELNENEEKLNRLKLEYASICEGLNEVLKNGELTLFIYKSIIEMSEKVIGAIARKYSKVKEGVKTVMGGSVLDYEAKRIRDQGILIGRNEGIDEGITIGEARGISIGRQEGQKDLLNQLIAMGLLTPEQAAQF